jgi:hypothetical protein
MNYTFLSTIRGKYVPKQFAADGAEQLQYSLTSEHEEKTQ